MGYLDDLPEGGGAVPLEIGRPPRAALRRQPAGHRRARHPLLRRGAEHPSRWRADRHVVRPGSQAASARARAAPPADRVVRCSDPGAADARAPGLWRCTRMIAARFRKPGRARQATPPTSPWISASCAQTGHCATRALPRSADTGRRWQGDRLRRCGRGHHRSVAGGATNARERGAARPDRTHGRRRWLGARPHAATR